MTKAEIINAVVELIQDQSPAMRGNVGRWVNFILSDIASRGYLVSLQREEETTLIAGNGTSSNLGRNYDLPPDTDKIVKVFVEAWGLDGILKKKSNDQFLEEMMLDGPTTRGRPYCYTIFGRETLRLHPIPSSDYAPASPTAAEKLKVWKYRDITQLVEADEITEIKMKHIPTIIGGAHAYGARFDDFADIQMTIAQYETGVRRIFADERTDYDRPVQTAYNDT